MRTPSANTHTHAHTHSHRDSQTNPHTHTHMRTISVHIQPYFPLPGKSFPSHAREFQPTQRVPTHSTTTHPLSLSQNPPFYPAMVARRPTSVRPFHRGPPTPANPSLDAVNSNKCITFGQCVRMPAGRPGPAAQGNVRKQRNYITHPPKRPPHACACVHYI